MADTPDLAGLVDTVDLVDWVGTADMVDTVDLVDWVGTADMADTIEHLSLGVLAHGLHKR
jgi:hypothetical protein